MGKYITLSIIIFSTVGGWLGSLITNGDWLSLASMLMSVVGALFGIWIGYWFYQNYIG